MMAIALTRHPDAPAPTVAQPATDTQKKNDPWEDKGPTPSADTDDDVRALVRLADTTARFARMRTGARSRNPSSRIRSSSKE
jgi:hypothetical protein